MFNKKSTILIIIAIFCIGITISSVSANDIDNSTLDTSYSDDEKIDVYKEFNNEKNEDTLQLQENESSYSPIDETKISSSQNDELGSTTWSGEDTETFYFRILTNNYVEPSSFEQIIVQRIHNNYDYEYLVDAHYYVFNSKGDIVYSFIYPNTRKYQTVYFESNSNVFRNLPGGTYKCVISEHHMNDFNDYDKIPTYYTIK